MTRYRPVGWGSSGWVLTAVALGSVIASVLPGELAPLICPVLVAVPVLLRERS